jgi:DNA polymerase-3 subunit gamma/tau
MSENTLYRKYRPYKLDDIVGQQHVKDYFKNAVKTNNLSHAYLFTGIRGTGKTSLARIISLIVNCENGPNLDYDVNSRICKAIIDQKCPDVQELDAASNTSIEDIREIRARARNVPMMCKKRIFIIDEIHCLNNKPVSALLKTLEEPPEHAMFILCTTEPNGILDTIQSRCQRFDLKRLSLPEISGRLEYICEQEGFKDVEKQAIDLIAKSGKGSLRDAISNLETVVGKCRGNAITLKDVSQFINTNDQEFFLLLMKSMYVGDYKGAIQQIRKKVASGSSAESIMISLLENINDLMISKCLNNFDLFYIDEAVKDSWIKCTKNIKMDVAMYVENTLLKHSASIHSTPRVDILLDYCIVDIIEGINKIKQKS